MDINISCIWDLLAVSQLVECLNPRSLVRISSSSWCCPNELYRHPTQENAKTWLKPFCLGHQPKQIFASWVWYLFHPKIWAVCIKGLFWSPYEVEKQNLFFTNFFFLVYQNNSTSVKVWYKFYFYRCYGSKNGRQNRLKIESDHSRANLRHSTEKLT